MCNASNIWIGGMTGAFLQVISHLSQPLILNSSFSRFYVESEGHSIVEAVWSEALDKSSINLVGQQISEDHISAYLFFVVPRGLEDFLVLCCFSSDYVRIKRDAKISRNISLLVMRDRTAILTLLPCGNAVATFKGVSLADIQLNWFGLKCSLF